MEHINEINNLSNEDLLSLYNNILEHIDYLNNQIINIEENTENSADNNNTGGDNNNE